MHTCPALLADFAALKMPFPEDFVLMFDVQLDYFLRCVTPSLVADLRSFHRFFEEYGAPNLAAKVHYLVVLKLTSFKILEADEARAREKARTRSAKSEQEIPSSSGELFRGDLTDDALDRLYQVYCNMDLLTKWRANPFYAKRTIGRMRHINGQLPEKYGGSSTAVYENADGALLKALVNGFLPGMILYSFPRNTTAPFSLTSVSMTLTIRCWAKASFSTM